VSKFLCPLCHESLEIRYTKKKKPYMTCETDGLQMFVRYETGIKRLEDMTKAKASPLGNFVVCQECDVAVKRSLKKIHDPIFGKTGWYCTECGKFLLEAPEDWERQLKD